MDVSQIQPTLAQPLLSSVSDNTMLVSNQIEFSSSVTSRVNRKTTGSVMQQAGRDQVLRAENQRKPHGCAEKLHSAVFSWTLGYNLLLVNICSVSDSSGLRQLTTKGLDMIGKARGLSLLAVSPLHRGGLVTIFYCNILQSSKHYHPLLSFSA